ncbi:hypothetical protein, partial [Pseudomonas sp.]|uniref:hypothetical protein n=1 Tax=Pseudomonas sp. TaxID=306 RepID=UPI00289E3B03
FFHAFPFDDVQGLGVRSKQVDTMPLAGRTGEVCWPDAYSASTKQGAVLVYVLKNMLICGDVIADPAMGAVAKKID